MWIRDTRDVELWFLANDTADMLLVAKACVLRRLREVVDDPGELFGDWGLARLFSVADGEGGDDPNALS